MKQNGPETINASFMLPAQLLEKFDLIKVPSGDSPFVQAEAGAAIEALKRGNPTELQIEIALAEIRNLNGRVKSLKQPEYANAFLYKDIQNESELASDGEKLKEAERILYEALVKIRPERSRDYKEPSEE